MDEKLAKLLLSDEIKDVPCESLKIYLLFRADFLVTTSEITKKFRKEGKAVTTLTPVRIQELTGFTLEKVHRIIDDLLKTKWIKKVEHEPPLIALGDIEGFELKWYVETKKENKKTSSVYEAIKEKVRLKKEEDASRVKRDGLSVETKRIIASKVVEKPVDRSSAGCKEILEHFQKKYTEKYSAKCPLIEVSGKSPYPATYVYIKRAIIWVGDDWREVIRVVDFIFNNWEDIKVATKLDGRPTFHMLGSSKVFPRIYTYLLEGLPKKTKVLDRFDGTKHRPAAGW